MLYNNNYGNGFSYPAPNNGVNYNNWDMNRQTSPGLNSLSNYVPNNQSARVYLKALPVTSLEEAKAAIVDLDGSMYVFVNVSQGEIYTKQYNLANGTSVNLCGEGIYLVEVNVDAVPTVAGLYSIRLVNNGVDVNGAEASVTGVAGDTDNLSFTTLIRVAKPCACNPNMGASLQVQVDTAVTLTNASMTVVKVA